MTHPMDIPTFQLALGELAPGDLPTLEVEGEETPSDAPWQAIQGAQLQVSVVPQCGIVLDTLKPHIDALSLKAAQVLAGAAHLVLHHKFLGRMEEADGVRDDARARIALLEAG